MKINIINKFHTLLVASCFLIGSGAVSSLFAQTSYQIVPRVRVGSITPRSCESELKRIYGRRNVRRSRVSLGEGEYEPGTVIYPNHPLKMIEIIWKDARRKCFPQRLQLTGEKSLWRTLPGISLGTRLKELERINGKPFVLAGFSWDYEGTVVSWEGGKLAQEFEKDGRAVLLRLSDRTGHGVSGEDMMSVQGDRDFPSSHQVMQRINPKVYQIIVEFP
jgi:hypothetical protein